MTAPFNKSYDLAALLGGFGGVGGGAASSAAATTDSMRQTGSTARMVSAASSVVSAGSLSTKSSSTIEQSSSLSGEGGVDNGQSRAIKDLVNELSQGGHSVLSGGGSSSNDEKKEDDYDESGASSQCHPSKNASAPPSPTSCAVEGGDGPSASGNPLLVGMNAPPHPVAEFLFQLTKMLTDNNSRYIEWRNASIFVHDPPALEKDILPKYFRHSNYSSFQRQMNYFGFRKIAGKGKMAPCSYVNEAAKEEISSLLFIKRKKTGVSSAAAKLMAQQNRLHRSMGQAAAAQSGMVGGLGSMGNASGTLMSTSGLGLGALGMTSNPPLSLNNFSMMGGLPSVGAGATTASNLMTAATNASALNEASLLREQQNMLAQLQQAHASALTSASNGSAPGPVGGMGSLACLNQAQGKLNMGGLGLGNGNPPTTFLGNDQANLGCLLTNDQGNIYTSASHVADWGNSGDASLFLQQATSGLTGAGGFPQGFPTQGMGGSADSNQFTRIDSAANLRALINQQISMFNTNSTSSAGGAADTFSSSVNSLAAGAPLPQSPSAPAPGPSAQQLNALSTAAGNATQGLSYEWNEMIQRMGGGADGSGPGLAVPMSYRQLEQQLLQGGSMPASVVPGPAASSGQTFSLNGFFGSGGAGGSTF